VTRGVLLVRGINVGRAHRVAMADLRELLTSEGHGEVRTLLQSGSVVLDSELPAEDLLAVVAGDPLGTVIGDPARSARPATGAPCSSSPSCSRAEQATARGTPPDGGAPRAG
jgi:hypothetical protein